MSTYKRGWPSDKDGDLEGRLLSYEERSTLAQANAAHAYDRLLHLAETRDSGQARIIAQFIASTYNETAFKFDLFDLRALDEKISDDIARRPGCTSVGQSRFVSLGA